MLPPTIEADTTSDADTTDDADSTSDDDTTTDADTNSDAACPSGQKADPLGKCRDIVAEDVVRTNIRLDGKIADFDQESFKNELKAQLGCNVTIIDAYEGSIVVVYEVSSKDLSLE